MSMFQEIEDKFAAAGRTPKGQRALRAIFLATRQTVSEGGLQAASLDEIAKRAGLTQAALRHYFATRDELLTVFFQTATEWFQARVAEILTDGELDARERLERCLGWHLQYMEAVDTVFWLEASAYWLRRRRVRRTRDEWYRWLSAQYSLLIGQMHPAIGPRERRRKAYAILTLVLGAWITHGRGSAVSADTREIDRRQLLVDTAMDIAAQ